LPVILAKEVGVSFSEFRRLEIRRIFYLLEKWQELEKIRASKKDVSSSIYG
jgi:hypothetical protein